MNNRLTIGRKIGVRRFGAPLLATLTFLFCLALAGSATATNDMLELPAVKSRLAPSSILMDVVDTGEKLVAVGERGHILLSGDNGGSWTQVDVPTSVTLTAVAFPTPEKGWAVGHDGVVLHSADGGKSWVKQLDGTQINASMLTQVEGLLKLKQAEVAAATDKKEKKLLERELENLEFFVSDAEMAVEEGPTRPFMDLWFKNDREGIIVGSFGMILRTEDGGAHWQPILDRIDNPDGYHYYGIAPAGETLFIVGERGLLFRSGDGGLNWQRLETPYEGSFFGVVGSDDGGAVVVFGLRGNAFISNDGGDSWKAVATPEGSTLSDGVMLADQSFLMVTNDGKLLSNSIGGDKYAQLPVFFPGAISLVKAGEGSLVLVGIGGVKLVSNDALKN
jgi:photosystem II stability/assembly factor-like uncharacterized protein